MQARLDSWQSWGLNQQKARLGRNGSPKGSFRKVLGLRNVLVEVPQGFWGGQRKVRERLPKSYGSNLQDGVPLQSRANSPNRCSTAAELDGCVVP